MGASDSRDRIEQAIHNAEAKLAESSEELETPASESDTEQQEVSESPAADESAEESPKQERTPSRDQNGKFTKSQKQAQVRAKQVSQDTAPEQTEDVQEEAEVAPQESQGAPLEIPGMWNPKEKQLLAKAPREVQEIIARREAQRAEYDQRLAREIEPLKQRHSKLEEVYKPHRAKFALHGVRDDIEAASRLFAWNELFEQDPKAAIQSLMQKNGLTPEHFYDDGQSAYVNSDPRLEQALQQAEEAKRAADEIRQTFKAQQRQAGQMALEQFKAGKDSSGNVRGQFFEVYRPQIVAAFEQIQASYPNLSENEALNHAYEFTLGEVRKLHGVSAPAAAKPAPKPALVQKARAAAGSVTGAPRDESAGSPTLKRKSLDPKKHFDDVLISNLERHGLA